MWRGPRELWALTGAAAGIRYAFDRDPDGSYSYWDRAMREAIDTTPWLERAALLRTAGVTTVITHENLAEPFVERGMLDERRGVRAYELPGTLPSVRLVGGIILAPHFQAMGAVFRNPAFDPATTTVLPGAESGAEGEPSSGSVTVTADLPAELIATTEFDRPGVLIWQRTYFPAWRAEIDGAPAPTVTADGHLVGVVVPEGKHEVRIVWPGHPVKLGLGLAALGVFAATLISRRWNQRIVRRPRPHA